MGENGAGVDLALVITRVRMADIGYLAGIGLWAIF